RKFEPTGVLASMRPPRPARRSKPYADLKHSGSGVLFCLRRIEETCQSGRIICDTDDHGLFAAANCNFSARQRIGRDTCWLENVLGDDGLAIERLRHLLQPRRHIDGIAEGGEYGVILKTDVADDHLAAMNTEAILDRLGQVGCELAGHVFHIGRNIDGGTYGLAARSLRVDVDAEQRKNAITDKLVRLTAGVQRRLRAR